MASGATPWHERAAFRLEVESRTEPTGAVVWRTSAYHEEHDQRVSWPGLPDAALIDWLRAALEPATTAPGDVSTPPAEQPGAAQTPLLADDLRQIPGIKPVIERKLHAAGIRTFAALAASTPAELAAITGRSVDQVTRMAWIEHARDLAAGVSPVASPEPVAPEALPAPPFEPAAMPEAAQPVPERHVLFVAILLDDDGEVADLRTHDDMKALLGEWVGAPVARFFVDMPVLGAGAPALPDLGLHLDDVAIETIRNIAGSRDAYRLRATAWLRIEAPVDLPDLHVRSFLLAYRVTDGATRMLNIADSSPVQPVGPIPIVLEADLPEIGRYQLIMASMIAGTDTLVASSGPVLRVTGPQ